MWKFGEERVTTETLSIAAVGTDFSARQLEKLSTLTEIIPLL